MPTSYSKIEVTDYEGRINEHGRVASLGIDGRTAPVPRPWVLSAEGRGKRRYETGNKTTTASLGSVNILLNEGILKICKIHKYSLKGHLIYIQSMLENVHENGIIPNSIEIIREFQSLNWIFFYLIFSPIKNDYALFTKEQR